MSSVVNSIAGIFGGNKSSTPPTPQPTPAPPSRDSAADAAAAAQEAGRIKRDNAIRSTLLTGGQGDTSQATVQKKTLLGQ